MNQAYLIIILLFLMLPLETTQAQNQGKLITRKIDPKDTPENETLKNFRFTVGGGYSYWLGKLMKTGNKKLDDFSSGLRSGYNIDVEAQYFFHDYIGIGLNGNYIKQSNSEHGVLNIPNVGEVTNYKESNQLVYIGASCVFRYENDEWGFYTNYGLGPILYTNTGEVAGRRMELNKATAGIYCSIAGERRINRNTGAGLKVAITSGMVKIDGLDEKLSVSNLILTGFISFRTK
ncbi:hypothetical protein IR083_19950 [Dysgonomonas sp. GY75]|uniref:hypothetical protein n=1 Tax=Dysgonomonas sp. GY75 TaxID=2780419 RepID=UPI0018848C83|nr:hypothetical protein [Dysgonomonas sp. GY75]MBF0651094.1 hypothetical protein [Dysgonomonas sp. GY75]